MTLQSTLLPDVTIYLLRQEAKTLKKIAKDLTLMGDPRHADELRSIAQQMTTRAAGLERKYPRHDRKSHPPASKTETTERES